MALGTEGSVQETGRLYPAERRIEGGRERDGGRKGGGKDDGREEEEGMMGGRRRDGRREG